jgi:hypothetical protein
MRLLRGSRKGRNVSGGASARADREQDFLTKGILELFELERRLALVAQHLEHGGSTLLRYFHAAIFEMHHVHLQRLDLKVPVVAAVWTGQRHEPKLPRPLGGVAVKA